MGDHAWGNYGNDMEEHRENHGTTMGNCGKTKGDLWDYVGELCEDHGGGIWRDCGHHMGELVWKGHKTVGDHVGSMGGTVGEPRGTVGDHVGSMRGPCGTVIDIISI